MMLKHSDASIAWLTYPTSVTSDSIYKEKESQHTRPSQSSRRRHCWPPESSHVFTDRNQRPP